MNFISPKNFKSGRLIANKYTTQDLIILVGGIIASFVLELIYFSSFISKNGIINIVMFVLFALPAGICLLLVTPFGVYHNVLTFIQLLLIHIKTPKAYIWGGLKRNGNVYEETENSN